MKKMNLQELEEKHGESRIKELEEQLKIRNQQIEELSGEQTPIHIETQRDPHIRFGVISDTHYGSYFHHTAMMHAVYEFFQSEGVTRVYHAGDVLDGHNIYKGQVIELQDVGYERQLQRFAKDAPLIEGIETHFITGNHDLSFEKIAGVSPGKGIEAIRPDWVHIGDESARVTFDTNNGPYTIELSHPGGGIKQYALSYRIQRMIDALEGGTKPDMLIVGHFHKSFDMPSYRNVFALAPGTIQRQTRFMRNNEIAANLAAWIVEIIVGNGHTRVKKETISMYV